MESERIIKSTGSTSKETRLYISGIKATAQEFNQWLRSHWAIENRLHWVLDVTFREDYSGKRKGYAAENFNTILKIVLTLLNKKDDYNTSYKRKRKKAALNQNYREILMNL
jgi:predicted transposase YbfD/YdcC